MTDIKNVMPPKTDGKRRFTELDALRGIAVVAVVIFHYTIGFDYHFHTVTEGKFYLKYGNLAVHLFFIISGFVIFMTIEKGKNKVDFLVSRFSRLFPAYWASIFLTVLVLAIFPTPTFKSFTIKEILVNLTMLQGFLKIRLIDQVYWTLKVELTFYVIMYVLFLTKSLNRIVLISFVWLLISLLSSLNLIMAKRYLDAFLILDYAPLFIAGISFYKIIKNQYTIWNHIIIAISFLIEANWLRLYNNTIVEYDYHTVTLISIVFVFYLVFYIFVYKGLAVLNNKVFLFFGSISYSFYLLHNVIGCALIFQLRKFLDSQLFYIPVTFLITLALAMLLRNYIEKPSMKLIRNIYKKHQEKAELAAAPVFDKID